MGFLKPLSFCSPLGVCFSILVYFGAIVEHRSSEKRAILEMSTVVKRGIINVNCTLFK